MANGLNFFDAVRKEWNSVHDYVEFIKRNPHRPNTVNEYRGCVWRWMYGTRNTYVRLSRALSTSNGRTAGRILAVSQAAEKLRAAGDFKGYAAKAEEVLGLVLGLDHNIARTLQKLIANAKSVPLWMPELLAQMHKPVPPWDNTLPRIPGHWVARSADDPKQISYYRSAAKLLEGKQLRTTPGKYLAEFYPELSPAAVKHHTQAFREYSADDLVFIENTDPDGWENVYDYPNMSGSGSGESCMTGESCVNVYAYKGNGLRLATLWQGESFKSTLIGRCIVRHDTDPPRYIRTYTNSNEKFSPEQFDDLMQSAGYVPGNLNGVRVRREYGDCENAFVMPYIDRGQGGQQCCRDDGDYMTLGEGNIYCCNTNGYSDEVCMYQCEECGDSFNDSDDGVTCIEGDHYCRGCAEEVLVVAVYSWRAYTNYSSLRYVRDSEVTYDESTEHYVRDCITDERGGYCEKCGSYHSDNDELSSYVTMQYGKPVHREYCCSKCTPATSSTDIAENCSGNECEVADEHIVSIRDGSVTAFEGDCHEQHGTWWLNDDHPEYYEPLDDPEFCAEERNYPPQENKALALPLAA